MRIKTVTYGQLKNTGNFQNERAEVCVELNDGESIDDAFRLSKTLVKRALGLGPSKEEILKAKQILAEANELE